MVIAAVSVMVMEMVPKGDAGVGGGKERVMVKRRW